MEKYWARARKFAESYKVAPSQHIIEVMASVMMTRDGVWNGGSFADAVVRNDLAQTIERADQECLENLRIIVLANQFAHI